MKNKNIAFVTMELSEDMEDMMKGVPFFLETEMLQGKRSEMDDGRIKYVIEIYDMDKAELVKEFVLKVMSQSHKACLS